MAARKSQKELLKLLQARERNGKPASQSEILAVTNWKEDTLKAYLSKGQLSDFLYQGPDQTFQVSGTVNLTENEFAKRLTQSKNVRGIGHNIKSRLARALLRKSRDNMILAMELYNRPSLNNRLDGFCLLFCTAWEQMLKARLIAEFNESKIFRKTKRPDRPRETIALRECLEQLYPASSALRKNIETITFYRDKATHLLMPEMQPLMARLFQSGILNYSAEFEGIADSPFLPKQSPGLLTIVSDLRKPNVAILQKEYGPDTANEIMSLAKTIEDEIKQTDDVAYAIPIDVKMSFSRKDENGSWVTISSASEGLDGLRNAVVLEKPVDREKTHPYRETQAIPELMKRLASNLSKPELLARLPGRTKGGKEPKINQYCFRAMIHKLKWRSANNIYHHQTKNPNYHYWSDEAINQLVKKVSINKDFIHDARESYACALKVSKSKA